MSDKLLIKKLTEAMEKEKNPAIKEQLSIKINLVNKQSIIRK